MSQSSAPAPAAAAARARPSIAVMVRMVPLRGHWVVTWDLAGHGTSDMPHRSCSGVRTQLALVQDAPGSYSAPSQSELPQVDSTQGTERDVELNGCTTRLIRPCRVSKSATGQRQVGYIAWAQPQREKYASSEELNGSMWVVLYGGGHCAPPWVVLRYARSCNESAVPSGRIMGGSCRVVSGNVSGCVRGCPTYSLFV